MLDYMILSCFIFRVVIYYNVKLFGRVIITVRTWSRPSREKPQVAVPRPKIFPRVGVPLLQCALQRANNAKYPIDKNLPYIKKTFHNL